MCLVQVLFQVLLGKCNKVQYDSHSFDVRGLRFAVCSVNVYEDFDTIH